jgi:hypothetical protein
MGKRTKLITIVLVGVILVSVSTYMMLTPKNQYQIATFTNAATQETAFSTSSEETSTFPTSSVGVTSTTLSSATILWINIIATRSVGYYLGLLQTNGAEPYVQLARELRKLPDLTNATAVAKKDTGYITL